ncbi:HAD family hydrolase [Paraburkholderia sp. BCC1886]|uniref:HAD family hydrolase n=1 Tax=Paraburkholderia sp. BCC1886 TaxID=2562670 RepID=UPI00118224A6|nr:HAD family hydrolase [Paraburkholderia sp. BCC1886]
MQATTTPHDVVFLFDCDNTLLDNDRLLADLREFLTREIGAENSKRYWEISEELRAELGYVDYLGALQHLRLEQPLDTRFLSVSSFLLDYPFADRLFPGSLNVLQQLAQHGPTVILSDGDMVFQPRKLKRSGLWDAVEGRVLIYVHKEKMLDQVKEVYPAGHYVMVDDKLRILTAMKQAWGDSLTTVFPRQGHYAFDPKEVSSNPPADVTVEKIGELAQVDAQRLTGSRNS